MSTEIDEMFMHNQPVYNSVNDSGNINQLHNEPKLLYSIHLLLANIYRSSINIGICNQVITIMEECDVGSFSRGLLLQPDK